MQTLSRPDALILLLAAPFIGSFLSLLVHRLPAGQAWIGGRSACPLCGAKLGWRDLVPLLSWLASRGRCRHCGGKIGLLYPGMELGALAVALWSLAVLPGWLAWAGTALGWCLLTLAVIDARHFILPHALNLPLIPAGLLVFWLHDPGRLEAHLIGAAAGFGFIAAIVLLYPLLRGREGMGWGDAFLMAAAGAWLSWEGLHSVILIAAASGLTVVLLQGLAGKRVGFGDALPFGSFLALGIWLTWLYGPIQMNVGLPFA